MELGRSRRVGDAGEEQVSQGLRRLATRYGFEFRDKVLLKRGRITAECDHVLVDRFGILIIETKVRNAAIRGTSTDKTWTAVYHGKNEPFQNPILQNMQHHSVIRQVLADAGHGLSADQVQPAVVFVGANLSRLDLGAADKHRVVDIDDLESILSARNSFTPNDGCLGPEDIARIVAIVDLVNQTGVAEVEDAHAAYRGGHVPSRPTANTAGDSARAHGPHGSAQGAGRRAGASSAPNTSGGRQHSNPPTMEFSGRHYESSFNWKPLAYVAAGLLAVALIGWLGVLAARGIARMTPVGWLVALFAVMFALKILLPSTSAGRSGHSRSVTSSAPAGFGTRVAALALLGLMFGGLYLFVVSGAAGRVIQGALAPSISNSEQGFAAPGSSGSPAGPGIQIAKARLRESNPRVYSAASNLNAPQVTSNAGGSTSYTWTYIQKLSHDKVKAVAYTLSLDTAGRVIGVNATP